jgi:hypothetical protein
VLLRSQLWAAFREGDFTRLGTAIFVGPKTILTPSARDLSLENEVIAVIFKFGSGSRIT